MSTTKKTALLSHYLVIGHSVIPDFGWKSFKHTEGKAVIKYVAPSNADVTQAGERIKTFLATYNIKKNVLADALHTSPGTLGKIINYNADTNLNGTTVALVMDRMDVLEHFLNEIAK